MTREWKPGDVALTFNGEPITFFYKLDENDRPTDEVMFTNTAGFQHPARRLAPARKAVVIDPEDSEQVERLAQMWDDLNEKTFSLGESPMTVRAHRMQAALREFANPTPPRPDEPTDPTARVTDRRENIWRQLADGDWVCTSGPDVGEYLNWDQLAGDRGLVTIEVDR